MSRTKKVVEPVVEPLKEETPLQEAPVIQDTRKIIRVYTVSGDPLHHPFQKRWIPNDVDGVDVIDDSWLQCQIKAGLIKQL